MQGVLGLGLVVISGQIHHRHLLDLAVRTRTLINLTGRPLGQPDDSLVVRQVHNVRCGQSMRWVS
jgi:hypothetical protein